jgi:hypothetical protein
LLDLGVADKSVFLAGGLADSSLIPGVGAAVRVSGEDVTSAELIDVLAIGVASGLTGAARDWL